MSPPFSTLSSHKPYCGLIVMDMAFTHDCLWTLLAFVLTWAVFHVTHRKTKATKMADAAAEERRDGGADVIIVGAGVGGSALAYTLAKVCKTFKYYTNTAFL